MRQMTVGYEFKSDDEFVHAAFADWKQAHGFAESIGLGDIDHRSLSEVLRQAQALKVRAREMTA